MRHPPSHRLVRAALLLALVAACSPAAPTGTETKTKRGSSSGKSSPKPSPTQNEDPKGEESPAEKASAKPAPSPSTVKPSPILPPSPVPSPSPTGSPTTALSYTVSKVAGGDQTGVAGGLFVEGPGATARFNNPAGVALSATGVIYVSDSINARIRKIVLDSAGAATVSTVAGSTRDYVDGPGDTAKFKLPSGLAMAADGKLYVADNGGYRIRRLTFAADGAATVDTIAGTGVSGAADGPGASATFFNPVGLAFADDHTLLVADSVNHRIRAIDLSSDAHTVSTFAGGGATGDTAGDLVEGPALDARFRKPSGLAVSQGKLYIADLGNHRIRVLDLVASGHPVTTLTGASAAGSGGGYKDGTLAVAEFRQPQGLAVAPDGAIFVADTGNHRVRLIKGGQVTTVAGSGVTGADAPATTVVKDGSGLEALLGQPTEMTLGAKGVVFMVDTDAHRIDLLKPVP